MAKNTKSGKTVDAVYEEEIKPRIAKKETKKEIKEEKVEETKFEDPRRTGLSDTSRGVIIGVVLTVLIGAVILLLVLAANGGEKKTSAGNSSLADSLDDYLNRDEPTLIVWAQTTCGWCQLQHPYIERIAEMYDLDYLFLNYDQLLTGTETSEDDVIQTLQPYADKLGITLVSTSTTKADGTPTSLIVQKGKVLYKHSGYMNGQSYIDFLIQGGILDKGSIYKDEDALEEITYSKFKELVKNKEETVILFDYYEQSGETTLDERKMLNELSKKYGFKVYHLSAFNFTKSDTSAFIDQLGDLGYSTDAYKENKSVNIPLLMVVKKSKIVWHQDSNMEIDDIEAELKKANIIK